MKVSIEKTGCIIITNSKKHTGISSFSRKFRFTYFFATFFFFLFMVFYVCVVSQEVRSSALLLCIIFVFTFCFVRSMDCFEIKLETKIFQK